MPSLTEDVQTAIRALTGVSTNTLNGDWSALADAMGVAAPGQVDGRVLGAAKLVDSTVPTADAAYNLFLYNPQLIPALSLPFTASDTLDPRITFTRASSGTHFDSTGRLVTDANDVARFDYDPATLLPRGLLIEESRTNLLLHSRDMTQGAWAKTDVTPTRNQVGIDGAANTACLMTEGVAGTAITTQSASGGTANTAIDGSLVLKRGNTDWVRIIVSQAGITNGAEMWVNLATGAKGTTQARGTGSAVSGNVRSLGGGWYRADLTCVGDAVSTAPQITILSASADGNATRVNNSTYIVDCAQLEVGAFATSIINTGAATATRAADSASMTGTNFSSWFNATQGTFVAEASSFASNAATAGVMGVSDGSGSNFFNTRVNVGGLSSAGAAVSGGVNQTTINAGAITLGAVFKSAHAYSVGVDRAYSQNGAAASTQAGYTAMTSPNVFNVGFGQGGNSLNGYIRSIRYYSTRLPSATLQALTT